MKGGLVKSKVSVRIDESDMLILDELIDLLGLNLSVVIQTILKVFLSSLCDKEGNILKSIKDEAREFTEYNSEELREIEELDY
jgi:hypothetical protein